MKVDAAIINHPKFLRLKKRIGPLAMEVLVRLWGHCEGCQKGEYWRGADAGYVEAVAHWDGEPGQLYEALEAEKWVHKEARGIRIHDWTAHNWRRVSNWSVGKRGGRPKQTQQQPNENPRVNPTKTTGQTPLNDLNDLNEVSEYKGDKKNGAGAPNPPNEDKDKQGAAVAASRTRWAALTKSIKELEVREEELSKEERMDLRKKRADLAELQKKQAAGDFSA